MRELLRLGNGNEAEILRRFTIGLTPGWPGVSSLTQLVKFWNECAATKATKQAPGRASYDATDWTRPLGPDEVNPDGSIKL